jgi:hypothetical protein
MLAVYDACLISDDAVDAIARSAPSEPIRAKRFPRGRGSQTEV